MADPSAWLILGSNIKPEVNLRQAVDLLGRQSCVAAVSSVWQSPPADGSDQPDYLNAAVMIRTDFSPEEVQSAVIAPIEKQLGRERSADKSAPRTIDIDLVMYEDRVGEYSGRHLPHPDILRQVYAAVPLAEISPDKIHPETGEPLRVIAARLRGETIRRREDLHISPTGKPVEPAPDSPPGGDV